VEIGTQFFYYRFLLSPAPEIILTTKALEEYEDHLCNFRWRGDKRRVWQESRYRANKEAGPWWSLP
jgi:hypothetical protein